MDIAKLGALLAALLPIAAAAQDNSLPSQPHLLVKGEAARTVQPDRFTMNVTLQATDLAPELARARVQADAASVLDAYRKHRALKDSIHASSLSIQPDYAYEQNRQIFRGTKVQRSLAATFGNLEDARKFLADTKTSEQLQVSGMITAYADEAAMRATLKREAAEQTRESAQQLATAYGMRIIGLYTISDVAPQFAYGIQAGTWPQRQPLAVAPPAPAPLPDVGARVDESLEAGSLIISENVYAIFLIAP